MVHPSESGYRKVQLEKMCVKLHSAGEIMNTEMEGIGSYIMCNKCNENNLGGNGIFAVVENIIYGYW